MRRFLALWWVLCGVYYCYWLAEEEKVLLIMDAQFMFFTYQACIIGTRVSKLTNNWSTQFVKKLVRDPEKQKKLISKEVYVHPAQLLHP